LAFAEQVNLQSLTNPNKSWFEQSQEVAKTYVELFRCPSDIVSITTVGFLAPLGLAIGSELAPSSYAWSIGRNDSLSFGAGFGPRPVDQYSGVFFFNSRTVLADIVDGSSNTFALGEAASGVAMASGVGSTTALSNSVSLDSGFHAWLVEGAMPVAFFAGGGRYAGGWGSTVEAINKNPVTDSFYEHTSGLFDNRASWQGGPHWTSNFRSLHPGGANFVMCDGSVQYLKETIDMKNYQALSTMNGGEIASVNR
jgi:prepilin-type processing-associated H-X9-DG protein